MNTRRRSFIRKIAYVLGIIILLLLVAPLLSQPEILDTPTTKGIKGGKLAQMRSEEGIDSLQLGKIDPTSEALRLATVGMRGPAAAILWSKALDYQKKKDWTSLAASLNQITKLQPRFISVWKHQGWNLAYNCSAEFDDYRQRYHWVIKGINFLKKGARTNDHSPILRNEVGWTISQKIGRSDEHEQFRKLFKKDDEFHGNRQGDRRDNWLVGKEWYRMAERLIDANYLPKGRFTSPVVFRSKAPMCQMNYAAAIEEDGVFGEKAPMAWKKAAEDWAQFGRTALPASGGLKIYLGQLEQLLEDKQLLLNELDSLAPGVREKLQQRKQETLTDAHLKAMQTAPEDRTPEQFNLVAEAKELIQVTPDEVVRNPDVPAKNRDRAKKVLAQIKELDEQISLTSRYRGVVNHDYWAKRAEIEQSENMLAAREFIHEGDQALAEGNLTLADESFRKGTLAWARVLSEFPFLLMSLEKDEDKAAVEDIEHLLEQYGKVLDQRDELFPPDFALSGLLTAQVVNSPKINMVRLNLAKAEEAEKKEDWATAANFYKKVLNAWFGITNDIPSLEQMSDRKTGEMILALTRKYAAILDKLDWPVPSDFPLHRFVRIQLEHDPETVAAQTLIEKGEIAREKGDLAAAREAYDQSFKLWRRVLDRYPTVLGDTTLIEDLMVSIDQYRDLLKEQKGGMPKDFILQDVLDHQGRLDIPGPAPTSTP